MLKSTWINIPDLFHGGKTEIKFVNQLLKSAKISIRPVNWFKNPLSTNQLDLNVRKCWKIPELSFGKTQNGWIIVGNGCLICWVISCNRRCKPSGFFIFYSVEWLNRLADVYGGLSVVSPSPTRPLRGVKKWQRCPLLPSFIILTMTVISIFDDVLH